jgi:hypothetical protein
VRATSASGGTWDMIETKQNKRERTKEVDEHPLLLLLITRERA